MGLLVGMATTDDNSPRCILDNEIKCKDSSIAITTKDHTVIDILELYDGSIATVVLVKY